MVYSIKNISFIVFVIVGCLSAIIISSCKNKCGSTTCQNGGTCTNNKCVCPTGYSGNSCATAWDDLVTGTYSCTRSHCVPTVIAGGSWTSVITKSATNGGFTVNISSFNGSSTTIEATVDSLRNIFITASGGSGVSGNGRYDSTSKTIQLQFTTASTGGATGYTCDMTMVKQ